MTKDREIQVRVAVAKIFLNHVMQLKINIAVHSKIGRPFWLGRIHIETGTDTEIPAFGFAFNIASSFQFWNLL